jgi:hypothetical protein
LLLDSRGRLDANNPAGARALLLELLGHDASDEEALYGLAVIAERAGDRREAIDRLNELLSLNAQHAQARESLARLQRPGIQSVYGSADTGIVRQYRERQMPDPRQPLLTSFHRPTIFLVNFVLERDAAPPISVEMRGGGMNGALAEGVSVAVPNDQIVNGRYEVTEVQRLDTGDRVVMSPLPTLIKTYAVYGGLAIMVAFSIFLVVSILASGNNENGWDLPAAPTLPALPPLPKPDSSDPSRASPSEFDAIRRRVVRERQRIREQWRNDCLADGFEPSFCNTAR